MARTVLLADDSVTAQNMGRRILMDAGYEVITVNNGSAALKKIHENKPDLIVLDVYMPGYGGLEVCQRLKETPETQKIPVLLTVGKMEPFKTDEAKRVHADAHIIKPFDASELLAALTKLEDRIVPTADGRGKSKSSPKKAKFWHSEDPAKNFDDSNTDQIAYLADVKKRQAENPRTEGSVEAPEAAATSLAAEVPNVAPSAVTSEPTAAEFQVASQDSPEAATLASVEISPAAEIVAPEFSVDQATEPFQADPVVSGDSLETAIADASSNSSIDNAPAAETKARWIAENVALSAEEASLELEREMQVAQAANGATADALNAEVPSEATAQSATSEPAAEEIASQQAASAFAAAAAVGNSSAVAAVSIPAETVPEPPVPSEAAAAWENWQHIRDSVMAPQNTAALAESVVELAQAGAPQQAPDTNISADEGSAEYAALQAAVTPLVNEPQAESIAVTPATTENAGESSLEGEALASIVDSVLAELKPKLMQEIARKLKK